VAQAGEVPVLVDNTFATPVLQNPIRHGATLVLHSATKSLGGHGDLLGGIVATTGEWAMRLRQIRALTGGLCTRWRPTSSTGVCRRFPSGCVPLRPGRRRWPLG
jgi:cystathionine beta-lyase/cystathionine gamma-synthase